MSIIRILISTAGYICCLYALGYYYVMVSNWTAYLVIPVIVLVTIEFIRFLLEELEEDNVDVKCLMCNNKAERSSGMCSIGCEKDEIAKVCKIGDDKWDIRI